MRSCNVVQSINLFFTYISHGSCPDIPSNGIFPRRQDFTTLRFSCGAESVSRCFVAWHLQLLLPYDAPKSTPAYNADMV
jgi:hypothetical protein